MEVRPVDRSGTPQSHVRKVLHPSWIFQGIFRRLSMVIDNDNVILVSIQNETITESQRIHIHCESARDAGDLQTAAPMLLSKIGPADLLAGDATNLDVQTMNEQKKTLENNMLDFVSARK